MEALSTEILAEIQGLKYTPLLCRDLKAFPLERLEEAFASKESSFIVDITNEGRIALSRWVSAKRTRSYPYARVYDMMGFAGKKVTVIPIVKDEGIEGDRDFLQWDTVSLMSLLNVYVIIAYYADAEKSRRYDGKIAKQKFDMQFIRRELDELLAYQSDALHWNLSRVDKIYDIAKAAIKHYEIISEKLGVPMHSEASALKRISALQEGKEAFMKSSRKLAQRAQYRESLTNQPKECLDGSKTSITIKNYLGGYYFFTVDEVLVKENRIFLVEGKHSKGKALPSEGDIKDGLLKMVLFSNISKATMEGVEYKTIPVLKLTSSDNGRRFTVAQERILTKLKEEASKNGFKVTLNGKAIEHNEDE